MIYLTLLPQIIAASLDIHGNRLSGQIPEEIYSLNSLKELSLHDTNVTGSLSASVANLSGLEVLSLGDTLMGGPIPEQLFDLINLEVIYFRNCNFNGIMPAASWSRLINLVNLDLAYNDLTGPLPDVFGGLPKLGRLNIELQRLTPCSVYRLFLSHFRFDQHTEELKLQGNSLTGAISQEVCDQRDQGVGDLQVLTVPCDMVCSCCDKLFECDP
jgi:hypothetical protein